MLDEFLDESAVAGSRQRIPEFPGGAEASRASREPRVTNFDQGSGPSKYVQYMIAGYSGHSLFRR